MVYFLLLISFLLHIFTFILIKRLKGENTKLQQAEENVNQQVNRMEDTLAVYLLEMKQENESLIQQLNDGEIRKEEKEVNRNTNTANKKMIQEEMNYANPPENFSTVENSDEITDTVESSLTSQVLHLKEKGYTVEQIAKELDKEKTEIELLLKFYRKK